MDLTLVVLAAGMGSRYGGLKQLDAIGPNGEILIEYSIYDAIRAGFNKVVFVIRKEIEKEFKNMVSSKFDKKIEVDFVYQELDAIPEGFNILPNRNKPWGTGHAIMVSEKKVTSSFAVINADDFYGLSGYKLLAEYLKGKANDSTDYAMVGFVLRDTLSKFGSVSRGVCDIDKEDFLVDVTEHTKIKPNGEGAEFIDNTGKTKKLSGDEIVSMNMWGFTQSIYKHLHLQFGDFLKMHGMEEKSEFFIPSIVDKTVKDGDAKVKVLVSDSKEKNNSKWFGLTYKEDKEFAKKTIKEFVSSSEYPTNLWI